MAYSIKEIFYSLQGEGAQAGLEANTRLAIDFCKSNPAWPEHADAQAPSDTVIPTC